MTQKETAMAVRTREGTTGVIPQTLDELWRLSTMLSKSGMAPKGVATPEAIAVAISMGLEIGLPPMAAVRSIAVINGRPSLWGDQMLALVRASGALEWIQETDDGTTATCRVKRRGEPEASRSFSQTDAKAAGLLAKGGPWAQYPARMRQMRARSWALRDVFTDVLLGFVAREEARDIVDAELVEGEHPLASRFKTAEVEKGAPFDEQLPPPSPPPEQALDSVAEIKGQLHEYYKAFEAGDYGEPFADVLERLGEKLGFLTTKDIKACVDEERLNDLLKAFDVYCGAE